MSRNMYLSDWCYFLNVIIPLFFFFFFYLWSDFVQYYTLIIMQYIMYFFYVQTRDLLKTRLCMKAEDRLIWGMCGCDAKKSPNLPPGAGLGQPNRQLTVLAHLWSFSLEQVEWLGVDVEFPSLQQFVTLRNPCCWSIYVSMQIIYDYV